MSFIPASLAWTFTDVQYRQNQYDLWLADSVYHHQKVLLLGQRSWEDESAQPFRVSKRDMLVATIDSFQVMKGLTLAPAQPLPDTLSRSKSYSFELLGEAPLGLHLTAGQLPVKPMITLYYSAEEMQFWKLRDGKVPSSLPPGVQTAVFEGPLKLFSTVPLGKAEIEFGMGYQGMPPIRGQSIRYPVVIVE